jgi:hypothetical protein
MRRTPLITQQLPTIAQRMLVRMVHDLRKRDDDKEQEPTAIGIDPTKHDTVGDTVYTATDTEDLLKKGPNITKSTAKYTSIDIKRNTASKAAKDTLKE